MYLIRDKEAQCRRHRKTCPMYHCTSYLKCPCCGTFGSVIRQFYFWQAPSFMCGIDTNTHINPWTHTHRKTGISLCTKSLTVTACLLNDQCVYMKSYHRAVCSTDKGHVTFFLFQCLTFGWKRWECFDFKLIWGFSCMEAYCIFATKKKNNNPSCSGFKLMGFSPLIDNNKIISQYFDV